MLFYAFGMLFLVFASAPWMIVLGFVLVGLAVGADIPASWSLIAEMAPDDERGKHSGVAQVLWYLGPVVVLVALPAARAVRRARRAHRLRASRGARARADLPALAHARIASAGRRRAGAPADAAPSWRVLLQPQLPQVDAFLAGMYGFWNLWAGTNGFFFPYILRTVGDQTPGARRSRSRRAASCSSMLSIYFIFMRLSDRVNQRLLFGISAVMQIAGMALLALFPLTLPIAMLHIFLMQVGGGFGAQSFFQLWSAEHVPDAWCAAPRRG